MATEKPIQIIDARSALAALNVDADKATTTDKLGALQDAVRLAVNMADPDTLDIVVRGATDELDRKYTVDELDILAPDARERLTNAAREREREKGRRALAAAEKILPALEREITGHVMEQQRLKGEAEQPFNTTRTDTLLARLLDASEADRADTWMRGRPGADVLARYQASTDDGPDRGFARALEASFLAGTYTPAGDDDNPLATVSALRGAIEARRAQRVHYKTTDSLAELERLKVDLGRAAAGLMKSGTDGAARVLGIAGRTGSARR